MTVGVYLNDKYDISDFVVSVTHSGDTSKFNHQLDVQFSASVDGRKLAFDIEEGDVLTFRYNKAIRFVGFIFKMNIASDGSVSITAYDSNIYLAKTTDTRIFVNKKASDIIRMLAKDLGIALAKGEIADTGYVIPYLKLANKSASDMVRVALQLTRKQTGKRFFIGNTAGWMTLKAGAQPKKYYVFEDGVNLISATYSRSIEDLKTQVRVIGGKKGKETSVIVKDDAKREKYGVMQVLETMDEKATASQIKQRASTLLKQKSQVAEQLTVEVEGIPELETGDAVYVINKMTNTNAPYFVTMFNHSYTSSLHTMSLELTRTYELPEITVDRDMTTREVAKKKKTKKKKTTKKEATKK